MSQPDRPVDVDAVRRAGAATRRASGRPRRGSSGLRNLLILLLLVGAGATCVLVFASDAEDSASPPATHAPESSSTGGPTDPGATTNPMLANMPEVVAGDPDLRTGVLGNGLTYYVRSNDFPGGSAQLRLVVDAGSAQETTAQSGVAHFLEHMLFNGTAKFPKHELLDIMRGFGAQDASDVNAYTSYDETVYRLTMPSAEASTLNTGLDILAEWLSSATLDPDEVVAERGVVLDEWRSSTETSDGRVAAELSQMFLAGSAFDQRAPIGDAAAISAMSPELLRAFYDSFYRPDNAAIVVVGDVDVEDVLAAIEARFGSLAPRTAEPVASPPELSISSDPVVAMIADPDLTDRAVELTLPMVAASEPIPGSPDAVVDSLIFSMIASRLNDDALSGVQPLDRAYVSNNNVVRLLDAPSVVVHPDVGATTAGMLALLDEFEGVHRFGFTDGELRRAVAGVRAETEATFATRDSRQDADFADTYADLFLTGAPILTEQTAFDVTSFALDHVSVEFANARFEYRWARSAPHVMVYGPQAEQPQLPTEAEIADAITALSARELVARAAAEVTEGELMTPPAPVTESSSTPGPVHPAAFLDSTRLEFANGVTVMINPTPIVSNEVTLFAQSDGGVSASAPDDVADAFVAADVVTSSGAGAFDQTQLNQLLEPSTADLQPAFSPASNEMYGTSSTADLEDMLALLHLYMTEPRFDPVALEQVLARQRSDAADPRADQFTAGLVALAQARFGDDPRFRVQLTTAEIETIDLAGVERAWRSGFDNAAGWTFVIVGDVDVTQTIALARQYLGTLVSTGSEQPVVSTTPEPPPGIVSETVAAGTGDKSTLFRMYSTRVPATVENSVLADIAAEIVNDRIVDRLREELGESYSPHAAFDITPAIDGGDDFLDIYFEVGGTPEHIDVVVAALSAEIAGVVDPGPGDEDITAAIGVVTEEYSFVSNEELASALLDTVSGDGEPADDYVRRNVVLDDVRPDDVRSYLAAVFTLERYVEIRTVPR